MIERIFDDGTVICRAGEPAEALFRIRSGALMVRPANGGKPGLLLAGDVFGAEALLTGGRYAAEAAAHGRAVLEVAGRAEVAAALEARPEAALPLIRAALDAGDRAPFDPERASLASRLVPMTALLADQIGADGVLVASFPFVVGRRQSRGEDNGVRGVDLVLRDRPPYNLSRRHFAVERAGGRHQVRDCGSHHGTFVNGARIGADLPSLVAALRPGDNEIVAGTAASPMRFSFLVE